MTEPRVNWDTLLPVYHVALERYGHLPNVTGVDVGRKYKGPGGRLTDRIAVRLHVLQKVLPVNLDPDELLPREIEGVETDVVEAVYRAQAGDVDRSRTKTALVVQPGISVGHYKTAGGTLGLIVYDLGDGKPCLLSNWHVLAGSQAAAPGDPVLQTCKRYGGNTFNNTVASLERFYVGEDGDAAIAKLHAETQTSPAQLGSEIVLNGLREPSLGEVLEKSGALTGVTRAVVDGIGRYFVRYPGAAQVTGVDGFKLVPNHRSGGEEISGPGDSGCVWYARRERVGVGLHFAGETGQGPRSEHALACHLNRVVEKLNVSLFPPAQDAALGRAGGPRAH